MLRRAALLLFVLALAGCAGSVGQSRGPAETYRVREVYRTPGSEAGIYEVTGPDGERRTVRIQGTPAAPEE